MNKRKEYSTDYSIRELPSIIELMNAVKSLRVLATLTNTSDAKEECDKIEDEIERIISVVDRFYALLGDRNWVFSNALSLERIQEVVMQESAEEAEKKLIEYLQEKDVLRGMLNRLNRFVDMRPRIPILNKAVEDYIAGRYYSSVLVTVSMMDGFVNDVFKENRKGLHARSPEEMHLDDCVAAVWAGLPSVQAAYTKRVESRVEGSVYDVHRNGIMHGMETGYDNVFVASKAWCMLFAVCDWAEAKSKEQDNQREEIEPVSVFELLSEVIAKREHLEIQNKLLDQWDAHDVDLINPVDNDKGILEVAFLYFDAWKAKNYGKLSLFFPNYTNDSHGKMAGNAKRLYSECILERYAIERIERVAPSIAIVYAKLENANHKWCVALRFVKMDGATPIADWEQGEWKLMQYGTSPFEGCSC